MGTLSGKALGADYLRKVEAYLAQAGDLPVSRDGTLNVTAIAENAGIPKQSVYKNPAIRQAIEQAKAACGVASWADRRASLPQDAGLADPEAVTSPQRQATSIDRKRLQDAERRVSTLEQRNAVLAAENFELRRRITDLKQQLGRQDMVIDTGRRIPAPVSLKDV